MNLSHRILSLTLLLALFLPASVLAEVESISEQALSPCVDPPGGMVAWWPFDESVSSLAYDLVDGNHGTLVGQPVVVPGVVDDALSFDGLNDRVVVPDDGLLDVAAGDFSIDAWVRTSAGGTRTILDKRSLPYHGYHFFLHKGRPGLQLASGGVWKNYLAGGSVPPGQWTHVAVTVDRDDPQGIRFYVDGVPSGPPRDPTPFSGSLSNDSPLVIGRRSFQAGGFWDGELDEVELFHRELGLFDVATLALAGRAGKCKCAALDCGPVAWWPLDAALFTAPDVAGHVSGPHDGVVQGARPATGQVASALSFTRQDFVEVENTVKLGPNLEKPGALSVDAWILANQGNGFQPIVSKTTPHPTDIGLLGYVLYLDNGALGFSLTGVDPAQPAGFPDSLAVPCQDTGCQNLSDGRWHLVGATLEWDAEGKDVHGHLYADGRLVGKAGPKDLPTGAEGGGFRIGAQLGRPSVFFEGKIDEVEVFDRALLESDFASLYAAHDDGKCDVERVIPCGSRGLPPCPQGQFCDFGTGGGCGAFDVPGLCRPIPGVCLFNEDPVCGCDGMTYSNECAAHTHGVSVAFLGPC